MSGRAIDGENVPMVEERSGRRSKRCSQSHETSFQILIRLLDEPVPNGGAGQKLTYFKMISLQLWQATISGNGNAMKIWNKYQKLAPKLQSQKPSVKFEEESSEILEDDR